MVRFLLDNLLPLVNRQGIDHLGAGLGLLGYDGADEVDEIVAVLFVHFDDHAGVD